MAPSRRIPLLSKSRFTSGLRCPKLLYLECYHRDLAEEPDAPRQAILDTGTQVGELARVLFPGGRLIEEDYLHHKEAVASTNAALSDHKIRALFEAAFVFDGVRIRADVLARTPAGRFDLIEFKSGTGVKEEHIPDVAIQAYVLEGCGLKLARANLGHLNGHYVYKGGAYELKKLFQIEDVTHEARKFLRGIPPILQALKLVLERTEPPDIPTGSHCESPWKCPFYDHCHAGEPEYAIDQIPSASQKLVASLARAGIVDIRSIPPGFPGLTPKQKRIRECVATGRAFLSADLRKHLDRLKYPVHFLDFEAFNPALPLFKGTRPYQMIPFQWSNHVLERRGTVRHEEFLHESDDDPRPAFTRSLLKTLGARGSIVVYCTFEKMVVRALARDFPSKSGALLSLVDRMVDLCALVRSHCYHPKFYGSFSLKNVLPALVPDLGYDDLDIQEGGAASLAFAEMRRPETDPERRRALKESLLKYCERDTEAELRLYESLSRGRPGDGAR